MRSTPAPLRTHPYTFPSNHPMLSGGPCTHAHVEALSTVLFKQLRFRCEPVEWVYDGLAPVLLPEVLQRRKGIPLSLCLVVVAVGMRLGMPLRLVCAQDALLPGVASGEGVGGYSSQRSSASGRWGRSRRSCWAPHSRCTVCVMWQLSRHAQHRSLS
jgi:hypothetical protein